MRSVTVYACMRPFRGEWVERNATVLNGLAWQDVAGMQVRLAHLPGEQETVEFGKAHGLACLAAPMVSHYMFATPQPSFKGMLEACLADCRSELFVYLNGDIVLGPGVLAWILDHLQPRTLYSLPRHNWDFDAVLETPADFARAAGRPEAWTALDLFAFRTRDAREELLPLPPFVLTAGSMDSWLVARAGELGWRRRLAPPDRFRMLHIEHAASHPFKAGDDAQRQVRWAFNCGVYAMATQGMPAECTRDTSLACFEGREGREPVRDRYACRTREG